MTKPTARVMKIYSTARWLMIFIGVLAMSVIYPDLLSGQTEKYYNARVFCSNKKTVIGSLYAVLDSSVIITRRDSHQHKMVFDSVRYDVIRRIRVTRKGSG